MYDLFPENCDELGNIKYSVKLIYFYTSTLKNYINKLEWFLFGSFLNSYVEGQKSVYKKKIWN